MSLTFSGAFASPDIFDRGHMLWPRAIGLDSCFLGLTFLKEVAQAECVIDPFCGVGEWGRKGRGGTSELQLQLFHL